MMSVLLLSWAATLAIDAVRAVHECKHRQLVDLVVAEHEFLQVSDAKRGAYGGCDLEQADCLVAPLRILFDTRFLGANDDETCTLDSIRSSTDSTHPRNSGRKGH